ncbi:ribokinase [Bombilactobacillus bombi]|uniref:ribokinase n=1 Tax=Bombilactobacillus bombi TaxID=1303590 RepID=UPI0015E5E1FD|nr:ribokinase [Bombilactobacillus bombi]MBA1434590.1 ribokinase [Bombilactobacillus bombi]
MVNKIVVLGSINLDSILKIERLPQAGETLSMLDKSSAPGGKGANQAVAAARAGGANTAFIGRIGKDDAGDILKNTLQKEKIDVSQLVVDSTHGTGQAYILLQATTGQNSILVYGGANQCLTGDDVKAAQSLIKAADFLICQFETPIDVTIQAFTYAHQLGVKTILNPAPAVKTLPAELLAVTDLICPNETEAQALTGIAITNQDSMQQAAASFARQGCPRTIITVGDRGAYVSDQQQNLEQFVAAFKVKAVDTTAAGDTFIGALTASLQPDFSDLVEATTFANRASSLAVQKLGAQPSIPTLEQVQAALNRG